MAVDAVGNVYFTDPSLPGIRKVDVSGAISTVVELVKEDNLPRGLAVDTSGIVYFTDIRDFRVYKVDASGALTTIAGLGVGDYIGDGGPATKVKLEFNEYVAVDGTGNVYIQDFSRIRKVDASGIVDTIAGGGERDSRWRWRPGYRNLSGSTSWSGSGRRGQHLHRRGEQTPHP